MKAFYKVVAVAGLLMMLVPSLLFYFQVMENSQMKLYVGIGTLLWFSGAVPWLGQKKTEN
jgi:hypothetical protein